MNRIGPLGMTGIAARSSGAAAALARLGPGVLALALALVAYAPLVPFGAKLPVSRQVESWLFLPSDRSTAAVPPR